MPLTQIEETITGVVDSVAPSVVGISTMAVAQDQYLRPFPIEGMGSGVLLREDGLVVTNHHVVRGARSAQVLFSDGRRLRASWVGGDRESDVALLRVDAEDLRPARLGDSASLRVGQLAIAIGSPFGHVLNGPTVTVGVVSALHRNLESRDGIIEDLVQTDAPINPGNSGGALLNSDGEIIGINTAIISHAQGIGFAIPVDRVKAITSELLEVGRVARPWLGIRGVAVTPRLARRYDLEVAQGVMVFHVDAGSPARAAGIAPGDVIRSLDEEAVASVEALRGSLRARRPGDRVRLDLVRNGSPLTIEARLAERVD